MHKPLSILMLSMIAFAGCKRNAASTTLSPEQIAPAVQQAFGDAKPEVKGLATDLAGSVQNKDFQKAFMQAQDLSDHTDLTPSQRQAATRTQMAVMQQLVAAAANGDQQAADFLKAYKATK